METLGPFTGIYGDYMGGIGIMENKMETTILYRVYII